MAFRQHTILNAGIGYGTIKGMSTRKITVEVPPELLKKAQEATGAGITETVRRGLQIVAASGAYERLRRMRGKYRFSITLDQIKDDR